MTVNRCNYRATDPLTTRYEREDGWRCGYDKGHTGSHELYTSDGEEVLYAGVWVEGPEESGTFGDASRTEAETRWPRIERAPITPVEWLNEGMASGFVLGAYWARDLLAEQEASDAEVEAVARTLDPDAWDADPWDYLGDYGRDARTSDGPGFQEKAKNVARRSARNALRAAARIRKEQGRG